MQHRHPGPGQLVDRDPADAGQAGGGPALELDIDRAGGELGVRLGQQRRDLPAQLVRPPLVVVVAERDVFRVQSQEPGVAGAGKTGGPIAGYARINAHGAAPSFATHIADVEVDPETGRVWVVRYTAIQDAGRAIHPSYVEGQYQGGVAQGIGWALNEEYIYGTDGKLQNPGFLDYRVPVASDLPMIDTVIVEVPNPGHPYGVRGVGEVPIVPPMPAIQAAIEDAIGHRFYRVPMSPTRILDAILGE